jgi:hypothetical protein
VSCEKQQRHAPALGESVNSRLRFTSGSGQQRLTCKPSIAVALASSLDLNTLDNLSRTCRQVRHALLQYRDSLVAQTLRCYNDEIALNPEDTFRYRARASNYYYVELGRGEYNGKSGFCARDLVAECRRCARVVCRVRVTQAFESRGCGEAVHTDGQVPIELRDQATGSEDTPRQTSATMPPVHERTAWTTCDTATT